VTEDYRKANHHPIAVLNGDTTRRVVELGAKPGETVTLSAAGSKDPDDNALATRWSVYPEAGTFPGELKLSAAIGETTSLVAPTVPKPQTIHVLLQVEDSGAPRLFAYRRAIITIDPR
jgi:hypothetical protein